MIFRWVDKRERMPTAQDTDAVGAILAWNVHDGVHVTNPTVFREHGTFYTHWATPPCAPEGDETNGGRGEIPRDGIHA